MPGGDSLLLNRHILWSHRLLGLIQDRFFFSVYQNCRHAEVLLFLLTVYVSDERVGTLRRVYRVNTVRSMQRMHTMMKSIDYHCRFTLAPGLPRLPAEFLLLLS